jgi:F-type H+-transporting ATPase subunit epsilon
MTVEVHLVTPEREVWTGAAEMLIARGVDGEVGILGGHAPLLARLAVGPLRIQRPGGEELTAAIDGGFLHVGTHEGVTRADVLASFAELVSEIDVEAARRAVQDLEASLAGLDEDRAAEAKVELLKARVRVDLAG